MLPLNSSKITFYATTKFLEFESPLAFQRNFYFQHKERRTTGSVTDDTRDTPLIMA
jgi:hypothetical protein